MTTLRCSPSTRFDTNYDTSVLNFLDRDIVFSYQNFSPYFLINQVLNQSGFPFKFLCLCDYGLDADTFQENGSEFYERLEVVNLAQVTSRKGWKASDGTKQILAY